MALTWSAVTESSLLPATQLVTNRRWDVAVKWRLFRHLEGGDDHAALDIYLWHIEQRILPRLEAGLSTDQWKRSLDDYVKAATALHQNMVRQGFDARLPIPVDPAGELLGGAHRLACALSLGIKAVPIQRLHYAAWAPAWGETWFRARGLDEANIAILRETMDHLRE